MARIKEDAISPRPVSQTTPGAPVKQAASTPARKGFGKDEMSTGQGGALRRAAIAQLGAQGVAGAAPAAAVGQASAAPPPTHPAYSFDSATYLSVVGNPPQYRITQQQCDELKRLGMEHGVMGMPDPSAKDYAAQMAGLQQELKILNGNGIRTDVYQYFSWSKNGQPRTDADVRAQMMQQLDALKGQPVKTFWLDVEFDKKLNPDMGAGNSQRMVDAAYQAFQDWKKANPDSQLEFGIYTGKGAWDAMTKGPTDPWTTKYAGLGVPLWCAQYPNGYDVKNIATADQDMATNLGAGFGGWSVAAGNIRGWQYRAGEHDGYQPTFHYGLDRNVWLVDDSTPPPPQTAIPSGPRPDLPVKNQALYELLKQDEGKPIDQRKFKTLQDLINHFDAKLGVDFNQLAQYRYEDPWKLVYGLPLGVDQYTTP